MPVRYSKQQSKTGASIGTIISVPKPDTWTDSTNLNTESLRWNIENDYPGWLECDGRELSVNDYSILYSILKNRYGGTPGSTFKLPDYRSKKIMGTGAVDSNSSLSPSLTPNKSPGTGNIQASIVEAGSEGGIYTVDTVRQLPPGSEISSSTPEKPDVFFDVGENVLGRPIEFVAGSAYQNYGTGIGETGGFSDPAISNGTVYIGFGTTGTSPFNSTQYSREIRITNLDLTGYSAVRIFAIAGNDSNGGERPNQSGEGLRVIWPNGFENFILPSSGDVGDVAVFDEEYTAWREIKIDIPTEYKTTGVTIRFRQDLSAGTNNPTGAEHNNTTSTTNNPNAFDMIGIQRIGFYGGKIGGDATDTFTIGTFKTVGFDSLILEATPNFSGNIAYSVGASTGTGTRIVGGAPIHFHTHVSTSVTPTRVSLGSPYYGRGESISGAVAVIYTSSVGNVITFNRLGDNLRSHSHMLSFGFNSAVQTRGNDNESGELVNAIVNGGNTSTSYVAPSNNIGNIISKTLNIVNDLGVSLNPGTFTVSNTSRLPFDNALSVRLQAAEKITLMSPYFRLKYIIKAY